MSTSAKKPIDDKGQILTDEPFPPNVISGVQSGARLPECLLRVMIVAPRMGRECSEEPRGSKPLGGHQVVDKAKVYRQAQRAQAGVPPACRADGEGAPTVMQGHKQFL